MKRRLSIVVAILVCAGPSALRLHAQTVSPASARAVSLYAELTSGDVLRYELEASASFLPQADIRGAAVRAPWGPCDYSLAAIVTLRPRAVDRDGNIPVEATFSEARVTSVRCLPVTQAAFERRLSSLEATPYLFRVGPHAETGVIPSGEKRFDYWNGAALLRKVTQDLLQTQFSPRPVTPGATWKPRGQFAYARDPALRDLELSGADMHFHSLAAVTGKPCAWITSKYVFSPLDYQANVLNPQGQPLPGGGNLAVAAVLNISLLLDTNTHRVAWLQRTQSIENKLTLAHPVYDVDDDDPPEGSAGPNADDPSSDDPNSDDPNSDNPAEGPKDPIPPAHMPDLSGTRAQRPGYHPFMTFHFQEDAKARLLPAASTAASTTEWLSALRSFEQSPEPGTAAKARTARANVPSSALAQAAKAGGVKHATRIVVDSETLLATPAGFTRYEKGLCHDAWFCATASVALPGKVEVADDTPLRTVFLARKDDSLISVAIGPALDRHDRGLTEDEELERHAKYYLSNYVWLAVKPGMASSSSSATLDGYPGLMTYFSATQRDLSNLHGVLGLILTPWGKVVPVGCSFDHGSTAEMQSLCEQVITSVSLRR
ncbi:MAG TPA: hypothetical protein VKR60_12035 [Candidatus Sulfotelmatobacter sp.]|nr:hypothetical protein [Candidatus Sulfotelmatobacter sp.]